MSRTDALAELHRLVNLLPEALVGVALFIVRRLASGERINPPADGIGSAADYAAYLCDFAVARIAEYLEHGPNAAVSPARISAPRARA
ncbi:MAG: hypothetical protein IT372_30365 [Polyangiaceae bacterium]|nr:hypothetical protein [Polyangiaceae bacterium]